MRSPNEKNQQQSTDVAFDVMLPINLVRQTIAYLESQDDPIAVMLAQHYKHWLKMSVGQDQSTPRGSAKV